MFKKKEVTSELPHRWFKCRCGDLFHPCFKKPGKTYSARRGNMISALGMAFATVSALIFVGKSSGDFTWIAAALVGNKVLAVPHAHD